MMDTGEGAALVAGRPASNRQREGTPSLPDRDWAADFSYDYYERLLAEAAEQFAVIPIHRAAELQRADGPLLLLRHDVDLCPLRALPIARREAELGYHATYFIMVSSSFYSLGHAPYRDAISELSELGHEIGLHFELVRDGSVAELDFEALEHLVDIQASTLTEQTGCPVRSVSFHRPLVRHLSGPETVAGLVNAYAERWMGWYLSDSRGRWREGEPLPSLSSGRSHVLQLLTHPIWWGEEHAPAAIRLQEFYDEKTEGLTEPEKGDFDRALSANISIPRTGRGPEDLRHIGQFDMDTAALRRRIDSHDRYGQSDLNAWIFEHLDPQPGMRILDLGSGTGKQSVPLAELVGPAGSVVALDASGESLELLRQAAVVAGVGDRVHTVEAFLHETGGVLGRESTFDRVLASYSLYYTQNVDDLAQELAARMVPGGRFFFCGPSPENNAELKALHHLLSGTQPEMVEAAEFMTDAAPAACARYFRTVRIERFENPLDFDSSESLIDYWRSHNLYDPGLEDAFAEAARDHFVRRPVFRTVKRVVGVVATR